MLELPGIGDDPNKIDYSSLPILRGKRAVVSRGDAEWKFRLHSYLAHFDDKYWCMWSHGPMVEDHPTQHIRYSTSVDGLNWSEPREIVGPSPKEGFRYISRGLWVHEGRLIALASHDEAYNDKGKVHFFGKSLELLAFVWDPKADAWKPLGVVHKDAINNFPPRKLPNGDWGMMCRNHQREVSMLIGGVTSPLSWKPVPLVSYSAGKGFRPEEPDWWPLPDGRTLLGLYRDNGPSKRLYRAVSSDNGKTWSEPEQTNFPDATSKFFGLQTSRGYYVLVSNANPAGRNPLCLSTSDDGVTFTRMGRLEIPTEGDGKRPDSLQYPHVIEHDESLLIVFSRRKAGIEVIQLPMSEIEAFRKAKE